MGNKSSTKSSKVRSMQHKEDTKGAKPLDSTKQEPTEQRPDELQIIKQFEALPAHLLGCPNHRINCHDGMWVVHGNQRYWRHEKDDKAVNEDKKIWYLGSVCWLELGASLKVHPGKYAVAIRFKLDKFDFRAVWKVGKNPKAHSIKNSKTYHITEDRECIMYQHEKGEGKLKWFKGSGWYWMYFGDHVEIKEGVDNKLEFYLFGNNPGWCHGLAFDVIDVFKVDSLKIDDPESLLKELEQCSVFPPGVLTLIMQMANCNEFVIE